MKPAAYPVGLTRRSVGLSEAHKELIKLLAEIAVKDYLAEIEQPDQQEAQ